ncbi:MAG: HD domain-containing phosphohydrolase, partial [bacterium]
QIPLYSRIIGVADAFEAMTALRPYKNIMTIVAAKAELERCSGTQFDPEIVKVFLEEVLASE